MLQTARAVQLQLIRKEIKALLRTRTYDSGRFTKADQCRYEELCRQERRLIDSAA